MFCIASFIIFAVIGIFSASHRPLVKKAWSCVLRRITFRPCDMSFRAEAKAKILAPVMKRSPKTGRFLDRWSEWIAGIFVVLSIWSLWAVLMSSLNLWIYDTCDPDNAEGCSLAGEACSVGAGSPGFWQSVSYGQPHIWFWNETKQLGTTLSLIPQQFKHWQPEEYISEDATYYLPFDDQKPTALEIIDPSCSACKSLFGNIKEAGFEQRYNLTYIPYPIPSSDGYRFPHSELITRYLLAMREIPVEGTTMSGDWYILEQMFTGSDDAGQDYQMLMNEVYTDEQALELLQEWALEAGYTADQVELLDEIAMSTGVTLEIKSNRTLVDDVIQTVKIPTLMFDGDRHDRVVDVKKLK